MFTKILNLQNYGQVQTLPVFVSEVKMTITLLLQLSLKAPYTRHSTIHVRRTKEKVKSRAQNENLKIKDITEIKWLGMDVILLRHCPVPGSFHWTSWPQRHNWSSSKQMLKMTSCNVMAALPGWITTGMAALPAWRTYWAYIFQKMFEKTKKKTPHFLKGHIRWWGIRFPVVMLT